MKRMLFIGISTLILSACGSTATQSAGSPEQTKSGYRCDTVTVTGSRMPQRRCTTSEQREAEKRRAEELMRQNRILTKEKL